MCGIAGYVGTAEIPPARIEACLARLRHRGPDHQAARWFATPDGRHVCLLHARLSIIDLDPRANQPFADAGQWIAFNGELYNYREVRAGLASRNETFATESDTEVLLRALRLGGLDALDGCEGMWAFAWHDEASGALTLCRDRFGEKPLYLHRDGTGLYFASEIGALTALAGKSFPVNRDHLLRYLVYGYKALYKKPVTFFEGVEELPRAGWLHVGAGGAETRGTYWTFRHRPDRKLSFADAVAGVRERLIRSLDIRLRADVPLAFCMSGGVDSNALIAAARRRLGREVEGFTVVNRDARYDERDLTRASARALGVRLTEVPVETRDFLPRLRQLVSLHDAPVYTISYYVHWLLMRGMADAGFRISISGTGADELFSGYYDHHLFYLRAVKDDPVRLERARADWETHIKPLVRNPFLQNPRAFVDDPGFRGHIFLNVESFRARLARDFSEGFAEETYTPDLMRNRMLNELFHESVPVILHEDDLNAMSVSIENRSPFLDRALFEFALSIPERHLVRDGYAKAVLREAMRGIVPDPVLDSRRKVGFNAPILDLLDVRDANVRGWLLDGGPIESYVKKTAIERLLAKKELPNSESKFLFGFVCAKMFLENQDSAARAAA
jgi:asparagine synthase (glutamine-hydrolysing)